MQYFHNLGMHVYSYKNKADQLLIITVSQNTNIINFLLILHFNGAHATFLVVADAFYIIIYFRL